MNEPIEIMLYETELMLTINVSIVVDLDMTRREGVTLLFSSICQRPTHHCQCEVT